MQIETTRLLLREMTEADRDALAAILTDAETMKYYPKPYDEAGVHRWINWCRDSYAKNGFGLWAVTLGHLAEDQAFCYDSHGILLFQFTYPLRFKYG